MEQRNEMLKKMRMSKKEKQGDIQHLLARSFSSRQMSVDQSKPLIPSPPPGEISIQVPQFPRIYIDPAPTESSGSLSLGDVTLESSSSFPNSTPSFPNSTPMTTITEVLGVEETSKRLPSS